MPGCKPVPLQNVLLDGFNGAPGSANVEVALDIEMAVAMAPGLSKIMIYEGTVANDILNRMATDNEAKQLSSSWVWYPRVSHRPGPGSDFQAIYRPGPIAISGLR